MNDAQSQPKTQANPYDSPWTLGHKIRKVLWDLTWVLLCSWTPKPLNPLRLLVLRLFGAKLEGKPFVHQKAIIELPWNLHLEDRACLGNRTNIYSLGPVVIRQAATVAQEAYLCTGTHDLEDPSFQLVVKPIEIGENAFVGARALILPGVQIGPNAVVGAGSVVTKDVTPSQISAGNPAKPIGHRLSQS